MGPINYSIDVQSPFAAALQGFQGGAGIKQVLDQRELAAQQAQAQQQLRLELGALSAKKDATGADYASMMTRYPQLSEQLTRSWSALNESQKQNKLQQGTSALAALSAGRNDVAEKVFRDRAAAARNSGAEEDAKQAETMAELIALHPEAARTSIAMTIAAGMGPDKFAATFQTLGDQARAADKAPAELAKAEAEARIKGVEAANAPGAAALKNEELRSQIQERAARLALDKDKLRSDVELKLYELGQKAGTLGEDAKKLVNDSTVTAIASDQAAGQMLDLADRLAKEGGGYGAAARAAEWLKGATGNQDALTMMRAEYTKLRNTQAVKNLPPGAASDADVKLAMQGFPPETADAQLLAGFLRGMAKLQQVEAAANSAKAEWVNAVGHLGKPKVDIEIDGIKVPSGTTFVDFSRQFLQQRADQRAAAQAAKQVQSRPYMRFAQPGAN
jgi:hypothetical protein